jgi:hypothetical protein
MKTSSAAKTAAAALAILTLSFIAPAGEIGHFNGGVMNIRDYLVPDPGFYGVVYNYFYTTDRINDSNGDEIRSVTIKPGPGPGVTLDVEADVDMYALAPTLLWVTELKALGIRYGALLSPLLVDASLSASLDAAFRRGGNVDGGSFGAGDLFVQPIMLGKSLPHWDFSLNYGFWAPLGKYDTETITLPVVGPVTAEAPDNLGYGFWTHQFQAATAWYPMTNKATAVVAALTYETNGEKDDFDLTPGDNLTLNWGISQFLPLKKDMSLLIEIGPAGYDAWQITDDNGGDASDVRDEVHAAGGQFGLVYIPWMLSVNCHAFYEFASEARFQGTSFGISIAKKF